MSLNMTGWINADWVDKALASFARHQKAETLKTLIECQKAWPTPEIARLIQAATNDLTDECEDE